MAVGAFSSARGDEKPAAERRPGARRLLYSTASRRAGGGKRECQRNLELIWLTGKLAPDHKTIADFRKDFGEPIRKVCRAFVAIC